jgi:phosphatidate phosphatase APP1
MRYERRGRRLGAAALRMIVAVEDRVQAGLVRLFGMLGRREITVLPFIGYGSPQRVRARGRIVLGRSPSRPAAADLVDNRAGSLPRPHGRWTPWRQRWATFREGVAPFLTVEIPGCAVDLRGPIEETRARADRQGYLDVLIDAGGLAPGWHQVHATATWRGRSTVAALPVLVVDPATTLAVVSDLDDTVIESGITRGLEVLRLTLLTEITKRTPLPGAAELYRALSVPHGGGSVPVFYLSTSPWNLYEVLTRFLVLRGFPAGPLLLADWGPSRTNLFRVPTAEHKLTLIRALLADHPALRVVLIGDTGQLDPEIYATVAQETPDRVRAIYVRRTVGMPTRRAVDLHGLASRVGACGVPMLVVEDSVQIAEHAAGIGLLDAADVQAVRAAT